MSARSWLRPSNLSRLAKCPASGVESEGKVSPSSEASALGRAIHEVLAVLVLRGREEAQAMTSVSASRWQVPGDTLREWLEGITWNIEGTAAVLAEEPIHLDLGFVSMRGTADVLLYWPSDKLAEVCDWKSGQPDYTEEDVWLQLEAYSLAAAQRFGAQQLRASLCYVRLGEEGWAHRDIDPQEALERIASIAREALAQESLEPAQREYRTGDHCRWCPARPTCPARNAELRSFAALIEAGTWEVTSANAPQLIDRAKAIETMCAAVREAVKDEVRAQGGLMVADDGRVLELVTSERSAYMVKAGTVERLVVKKGMS